MKVKISWARFYEQFKADLKLWCFFVIFQQICRACFIAVLARNLAPSTHFTTILYAMANGLRFDSVWATCWLFIALLFFTIPRAFINNLKPAALNQWRKYLGGVFTSTTAFIYIASVEYFREYKDVFNQFLFNWFYDDKGAILKTIYADHHVVLNLFFLVAVTFLYIKFSSVIVRQTKLTHVAYSRAYKVILTILIVGFYIVGFRGSIGHRPVQQKDAGITIDSFLNQAIVSPYSSLKYAIDDYQDIKQACKNEANLSFQDIQAIAKKFFGSDKQYPTLAQYLEKTASGSSFPRPKHIFLIVGESLDAWPLQAEYKKFNLDPNLRKIIADGAIYFKYFLPCASGTMETLNTLMSGIPDSGLHINYQQNNALVTTLATQLRKLGYKTQFFYGGYLSWQRVGDFASSKDFAAVYGAAHIKSWQQTNEWGVDDRTLFNFIVTTIKAAKTPTFNVIMTTSNHPPFSINLDQEGFDQTKTAQLLAQYPQSNTNVKELGHIWYADKTIGEFIKNITAVDTSTLIAITGDHYGRRHILFHAPSFEVTAVPLIITGPNVKTYCQQHNCNQNNTIAGSHMDLAATLIELVAPKGFTYYSLGNNLLGTRKLNLGIGKEKIITPDFIASAYNQDIMYFNKTKSTPEHIVALQEKLKQAQSIARYIIEKGDGKESKT